MAKFVMVRMVLFASFMKERQPSHLVGWSLGIFLLGLVIFAPTAAHAQTAVDKLGRGLAGMITGILELPGNMIQETHERGPAAGIPIGLAKGLGMVVARELVGVYEFVTSPIPVPPHYAPILKPEYPWDYFRGL